VFINFKGFPIDCFRLMCFHMNGGSHMNTQTIDFLIDAAKAAKGIESDYRLAKVLGVTDHTIYNYRHGRSRPDELRTFQLCEMAGIDPSPWLMDIHAERAKDTSLKSFWESMAKRMRTTTAIFILAILANVCGVSFDGGAQAKTLHTGAVPTNLEALTFYTLWKAYIKPSLARKWHHFTALFHVLAPV